MDIIRPQEAARMLMENAKKIGEATDVVIDYRNAMVLKEAEYLDAKAEATKQRLAEGLSATAVQVHVAIDTTEEKIALIKAEARVKNFQDILNVLETSNNNYKMAIKIMEMEAKNLNLS